MFAVAWADTYSYFLQFSRRQKKVDGHFVVHAMIFVIEKIHEILDEIL
jgi:hypothetical protein